MPRLSTPYQIRAIGLCAMPFAAVISCSVSLPGLVSTALVLLPVLALVILDIFEYQRLNLAFDLAKRRFRESKLATTSYAQSGRTRMSEMTPERTGKVYLVVGTGGVGRRIIEVLQERGEKHVYGLDICPPSVVADFLDESHYFQGDVSDFRCCENVVKKSMPAVIYHTAAVITFAQKKPHQWDRSHRINVKGVENMLLASTEASHEVEAFILTSSSTVGLRYPMDCYRSLSGDEERFKPVVSEKESFSWYTRSKAMAEVTALEFCSRDNAVPDKAPPALGIIRPSSSIFHARDFFGCQRALNDLEILAFGFEYIEVDYVYVDNVVLGHLLLEKRLSQGKCHGETFIISNGEPMSSSEFAARIATMVSLQIGSSFCHKKISSTLILVLSSIVEVATTLGLSVPNDLGLLSFTTMTFATVNYQMDDKKARTMLGYKPAFTVNEGILQTIEDHGKAFPDGKLAKSMIEGSEKV